MCPVVTPTCPLGPTATVPCSTSTTARSQSIFTEKAVPCTATRVPAISTAKASTRPSEAARGVTSARIAPRSRVTVWPTPTELTLSALPGASVHATNPAWAKVTGASPASTTSPGARRERSCAEEPGASTKVLACTRWRSGALVDASSAERDVAPTPNASTAAAAAKPMTREKADA